MILSLDYIGFTSPRHADWNRFGPDVLGLQPTEALPDGSVRLRMDEAAHRITIHPGDRDDLAYLGWGVSGPAALEAAAKKLADAGIDVRVGGPELAAARAVGGLIWFVDERGHRHELAWGQLLRPATFRPGRPISGFVTGAAGLGHAVLMVPDLDAAERLYVDLLGFRLSDQIEQSGTTIRFYHCNSRHHTLALIQAEGVIGFQHLMLELASLEDVGSGFDLVADGAAELTLGLGCHTNDRMVSFYVRTPAGFDIEYGWGGVDLTDGATVASYQRASVWGHRPTGGVHATPGIMRPAETAATHG